MSCRACATACVKEPLNPKLWARGVIVVALILTLIFIVLKASNQTSVADMSWAIALLPLIVTVFLFLISAFGVAICYSFVGCFRACREKPLSPKLWARGAIGSTVVMTGVLVGLKGAGRTAVADQSWWIALLPLLVTTVLASLEYLSRRGVGHLRLCGRAGRSRPRRSCGQGSHICGDNADADPSRLKETDRTAVASMPRAVVWVPFMVAAFSFIVVVFGRAIVLSIRRAATAFYNDPENPTYWCRVYYYANLVTFIFLLLKARSVIDWPLYLIFMPQIVSAALIVAVILCYALVVFFTKWVSEPANPMYWGSTSHRSRS